MNIKITTKSTRPVGVWVLTICNILLGGILCIPTFRILFGAWSSMDDPIMIIMSPYAAVLIIMYLFFVYGAWRGNRFSRVFLLGVLLTIAILEAVENALVIDYVLSNTQQSSGAWWSLPLWWEISSSPRWVLWLALNYWYFFGSHAREFFDRDKAIKMTFPLKIV